MKLFTSLLVILTAFTAAGAEEFAPLPLAETVKIGSVEISTKQPPSGLTVREVLGLVTANALDGQVVHRTTTRILETRATITPGGDYLLMFPEGDHYAKSKGEKMNTMIAYRSSDKGRSWQGPTVAFDIPYSQHGFIPFIPRGSKRIYAFGTQPIPGKWTWENGQRENAPIGFRCSDDDGRTWSDVKLIEPVNDPEFRGMSVMRMTETDAGTWLLGSHLADWSVKPLKTQQYLLRSKDQGKTWTVLPGARPNGWIAEGFDRMDEGRPLNLGGGRVLFMSRTPQGHLFTAWSKDDGKTWTRPAPSSLVHPDAPPMLFPLSDGKTLVAFHHNKVPPANARELDDKAAVMKVRSEIWASLSTDEGHSWSEPRFVMANAVQPLHAVGGFNFQCSYLDAFTQDGVLHIFMPHRWQQVLHLTMKESALATLPTQAQLLAMTQALKAAAITPAGKATANFVGQLSGEIDPAQQVDVGAFRIERSTVLTSVDEYHWAQSRAALIPGNPTRVIVTTQEIEKHGSHGYRDVYFTETTDGAHTWSAPKRIESLARSRSPQGIESVMGDICPQWHETTHTLLATGKAFGFRADAKDTEAKDDRSFEKVAYAVWSPATQQWSGMKIAAMPPTDHEGRPIIEPNAGCNQRWDLPNGDVLLPVRYRADAKSRIYTTMVARCSFDGETLTYRGHGSEFSVKKPRGLYEPSVCGFKGRYFLTMRAEDTGYVASGTDGVNYEPIVEWAFDDGKPLGSYNTQQHWITHGDELYLIYTRRGANNDHVFRNRAPIFIARVDPDRLCVLRATEQVLLPETGVDLGGGFAPLNVNAGETWVISTEMAFPKNRADESNRVLLAKIVWRQLKEKK